MSVVADGDLLTLVNVLLSKEDGNAGRLVIDDGRVRLVGVIHAGVSKGDEVFGNIVTL